MQNWKSFFDKKILDRGFEYYKSGMVSNIDLSEDMISAVVEGNNDEYEIEIEFEDGVPSEMYCTCPYADDGNYCKHMAAVLYKWEQEENNDNSYNQHKISIDELVAKADETSIRRFLIDIMRKDDKLVLRFQSMISDNNVSADIGEYIKSVDLLIESYARYDGFMDYYDVESISDDLGKYDNVVEKLIDAQRYIDAFELTFHIFSEVAKIDFCDDEYNVDIEGIFENMTGFWRNIIKFADQKTQDNIFYRLLAADSGDDNGVYFIRVFIYSEFEDERYYSEILQHIQSKIDKFKNNSSWEHDYKLKDLVKTKLRLMHKKNGLSLDAINYCKEYWYYEDIREWLAEKYVYENQYANAIKIYEEIENDSHFKWRSDYYKRKLKELYLLTGQKEKYEKKVWELVIHHFSISEYRELKKLFSEDEWQKKREEIIRMVGKEHLPEIFNEEKMYDKLLESMKGKYINVLMTYDSILGKYYPQEVLGMYENYLNSCAERTADRKIYQSWVRILEHMKIFNGGTVTVEKIISEWRLKYRNRPAMLDELSKIR